MIYGSEQALIEKNPFKRVAFKCVGMTHLGERSRHHYLVRALQRLSISPEARVLNAGSANGAHSFYLSRQNPGWTIEGVEIDPQLVERARTISRRTGLNNVQFRAADLREISDDERFDLIICMHVLTYLPDDLVVLRRFYRALKKGGHLILSVPTPPTPPRLAWLGIPPSAPGIERVGYLNTEIREKIEEVGFDLTFLCNPAGYWGQIAWEISRKLGENPPLRAVVHPLLMFLVDFDHWRASEAPFPEGHDCLLIAQKQ